MSDESDSSTTGTDRGSSIPICESQGKPFLPSGSAFADARDASSNSFLDKNRKYAADQTGRSSCPRAKGVFRRPPGTPAARVCEYACLRYRKDTQTHSPVFQYGVRSRSGNLSSPG